MPGTLRNPRALICLVLVLLATLRVSAQLGGVDVNIDPKGIGLGGHVQRGVWTPVLMELTNTGSKNIEVNCRWLLSDDDGDELIAERTNITLVPLQKQGVWLYANPPMSTRPSETWSFQVVDTASGELVAQVQRTLSSSAMFESSNNVVGICGTVNTGMGLYAWRRWSTQHEQLRVVSGLNLATLPDRWYGLDMINSLVWCPIEGGEPTNKRVSENTRQALREWVYRGGHLVIVLPYGGEQWSAEESGLSDLIRPIEPGDIRQSQAVIPSKVFGTPASTKPVSMLWFDLTNAKGYTSLAEADFSTGIDPATLPKDARGNPIQPPPDLKPVIVGHRFGFGQVTLVGMDLSEKTVANAINDFRLHRVWTHIFSWRGSKNGELIHPDVLDDTQTKNQFVEAKDAQPTELGSWIASKVARQRQTGPAVGLAFVLFIIYAIVAALTFPSLLRSRGWERHSWMLFVGVVALFSIIAWGGAWALRPASSSASHFTVLDIDGNTGVTHARSWQSLLIPSFTTAEIQVPSSADGLARMDVVNLLSSPGHALVAESPGYPDQRTYAFDTTQPNKIEVPMRSTTKSLIVDYLGQITAIGPGMPKAWDLPRADKLRIANNGLPAGTITHNFPGPLKDVRIIFCPGGAQQPEPQGSAAVPGRPLVYEYKNASNQSIWQPITPIALPASMSDYTPLWRKPRLTGNRNWQSEGWLGAMVNARGFGIRGDDGPNIVKELALLSFYDALPPPEYETQGGFGGFGDHNTYQRSLMRDLDLTRLITGRRIILIGHLTESPSPIPMTVDGEDVESEGWTVVRWIYDL